MLIKRWDTGAVIYTSDATEIAYALAEAARAGVDLYRANLDRANLYRAILDGARLDGARLDGARLVGARLIGASLDRANLYRAILDGARLDGASLIGANLDRASLDRASLIEANLIGASLDRAILIEANLIGASLDRASLDGIRADVWAILSAAPAEVPALLDALKSGRFDGSHYEGECACLVGTIANARHVDHDKIPGLSPDSSRPAERWALAIRRGHTPSTNPIAAITVKWIEEWQAAQVSA
jgi:hypothetical protein